MEQADYFLLKRCELLATVEGMISGAVDLLVGVRRICSLRFEIGDPDNKVFLPIRAIESDTDAFPVGDVRSKFSPEYLKALDLEMSDYFNAARSDILGYCRSIRDEFSGAMRSNKHQE